MRKHSSPIPRILSFILIFLCAFLLPWWATLLVALVAAWMFEDYYEIIFFGFLLDLLYGGGRGNGAIAGSLLYTLIAAGAFGVTHILKKKIFVYQREL